MDPSPTATTRATNRSDESNGMEVVKRTPKPKIAELKGSTMTLSGEDDGLAVEATQILQEYAVTKGHTLSTVTHMSCPQLADFLRDFYSKMKLKNDECIPLKDVRNGLHKYFLEEVNIDILQDRNFDLANSHFDQGLLRSRKCHKVRIDMEDLRKIYLSDAMDTNKPDTLQNKVFFDISLYVCNKGKDYFRNMKKNDFEVTSDIHGRRYVWLKDASATPMPREEYPPKLKLKRAVEESNQAYQIGERMYERPGDPRCPLSSFLKYLTHLHPMLDAFWQRPKRSVSPEDIVWYEHAPLGSSTLTKIMQRISQQAGVNDNYTNYSIKSNCIPLVEAVCQQAMMAENGTLIPNDHPHPRGLYISHSNSEDISSDDGLANPEPNNNISSNNHSMPPRQDSHNSSSGTMNGNGGPPPAHLPRDRPPRLGHAGSSHSSSLETEDGDHCGLMQAKAQVLDLIRGLMVKDIQKFVDWLKTVRVQYSAGELIVLCSPVEKSNVEPIPEDILVDRNGVASPRSSTPERGMNGSMKKSCSLDLSDKRQRLKKEASLEAEDIKSEFIGTSIKRMEFSCVSGVHCSTEDLGPLKVTVPGADSVLLSGVPHSLQVLLHKKRGPPSEHLSDRIFSSEGSLDLADVCSTQTSWGHRPGRQQRMAVVSDRNAPATAHNNHNHSIIITTTGGESSYHPLHGHAEPPSSSVHGEVVYHKSVPAMGMVPAVTTSVQQQQQQQHGYHPTMIPVAHSASAASLSREHYKEGRSTIKSMPGFLEVPQNNLLTPAERGSLKRGSSTGTPVLKRQAHVLETGMYPENLTMRRAASEDSPHQPTNLSLKPGNGIITGSLHPSHHHHMMSSVSVASAVPSPVNISAGTCGSLKKESLEAKKARAEQHLDDTLRYHQEILQNSPLIKRPGERNFSGFRHCYANTVNNHSVKPEPLDTSYS